MCPQPVVSPLLFYTSPPETQLKVQTNSRLHQIGYFAEGPGVRRPVCAVVSADTRTVGIQNDFVYFPVKLGSVYPLARASAEAIAAVPGISQAQAEAIRRTIRRA